MSNQKPAEGSFSDELYELADRVMSRVRAGGHTVREVERMVKLTKWAMAVGRDADSQPAIYQEPQGSEKKPQGFTVFLRQANGEGTTHISFQEEADRNAAVYAAIRECRTDWGWEDDGSDEDDDLHVLGVAAGDVTIVEWDDLT